MPVTAYKDREVEPVITAALEMYNSGMEIEQASTQLGVPARTIYRWLSANGQDEWQEAQKARLLADYQAARAYRDQAGRTLDDLKEQLTKDGVTEAAERNWRLAHAREVVRAADTALDHQKWLLERLFRRIYGNDTPQVQINLNIGNIADKIKDLEHELLGKPAQAIEHAGHTIDTVGS